MLTEPARRTGTRLASVKNLRARRRERRTSTRNGMRVTLSFPDPGTKLIKCLVGWYRRSFKWSLIGKTGDQFCRVEHGSTMRDGAVCARSRTSVLLLGAGSPESVEAGCAYRSNSQATAQATKADCAGFDG